MSYTSLGGVQAIAGTFIGLTVVTVSLRFYARTSVSAGLRADDWCMLVALVSFLVFCACVLALGQLQWVGNTSPTDKPSLSTLEKGYRLTLCVVFFLNIALAFTKISALLLYRRIFCFEKRSRSHFESIIFATIILIASWLAAYTGLAFWQFAENMSHHVSSGRTVGWQDVVALCAIDLVFAIWVVSLPIPKIIRLHMTPSNKLLTLGLFSIAFLGVAASIARLVNIVLIDYDLGKFTASDHAITRVYFFHILELGTSIVAINAPILWIVVTRLATEDVIRLGRAMSLLSSRDSNASKKDVGGFDARPNDATMAVELAGNHSSSQAHATRVSAEHSLSRVPTSKIVVQESFIVSRSEREPGDV